MKRQLHLALMAYPQHPTPENVTPIASIDITSAVECWKKRNQVEFIPFDFKVEIACLTFDNERITKVEQVLSMRLPQ